MPVSIKKSEQNESIKEIRLENELVLQPDETQLIWLQLEGEASKWKKDKVLQPETSLLTKHKILLIPAIYEKGGKGFYCTIVVNIMLKTSTIPQGTVVGKLFDAESIPPSTKIETSTELLTDLLQRIYINHHDQDITIQPMSMLEGPVFQPSRAEMNALGVYTTQRSIRSMSIKTVEYGPELPTYNVANGPKTWEFDINPELTEDQKGRIISILNRYSEVFASSLQDVKALNVEPHSIQLRTGAKPVKVPPRLLPYEANE
ncbi:hypothetical protein A0J61_11047, partial [Choanephora cucurbitarum]